MFQEIIQKLIKQAIQKLPDFSTSEVLEIQLDRPTESSHGDYATNVALVLAKKIGKNPRTLAEEIISLLVKETIFEKVEVAGPGFINFFIARKVLFEELQKVLQQKKNYGRSTAQKSKKIIVEFTDPNPLKEFHVGHLYSNAVGESLCRLLEALGATVKRANYQGDIGLHVAKAVWGYQELEKEHPEFQATSVKDWALGYVFGAQKYEEEEGAKAEINDINKRLYAKSDKKLFALYQHGRRCSLEYFEAIYRRLGMKFDYYFFESEVMTKGKEIVQEGLEKGIFQESQGAVIFPGEQYGLHSRVFINSQKLPTYEAKELGLAVTKYKKYKYDKSIVLTGNEINEYFKVLLTAIGALFPEIASKTTHIGHGMVRLPEGKMSSRTGKVIAGDALLNDVKEKVSLMDSLEKVLPKEKDAIAEKITMGAVKYAFLKSNIGQDIIFDAEKSLAIKGNSGPYLQYAVVRCKSVLKKAGVRITKPKAEQIISEEEVLVLRMLFRFPEIVQEAAEKLAPNIICNFAFDLAQQYNTFYDKQPILKVEDKEIKNFRLLLTAATKQVLENALCLLGIEVPERM